ncbi:MAG TPA: FAD-dependent monooxygenase, partial [Candidatus Dormibacteraeota bacterium]|nr:FAD-dependent monooxygenase [Candidatus Dormibacteraeota bacterium]
MAGSSVAIRLAQQGRKVLMVDRDTFPSDTLSTHALNFTTIESLSRLGVLQRIEAAGFRRLYRHRAWVDDICIDVPAGPRGAYSLAPRRKVLDQILIERAVECGAEFIERARVESLIVDSGNVAGAVVQRIGGERFEVRAKVVVGADGKSSSVAKWVAAEKYDERPFGRPIYYAYCHGLEPLADPAIEFFFESNRVGFCLAMRPDEHCLVIESQP